MSRPGQLRALARCHLTETVLPADAVIVEGVRQGEACAADWLYARVHLPVVRTLRRVLGSDQQEHDDLVQASFEKMIRVLSVRVDLESLDLPAWASAVSARVALDALRRRSREQRLFHGLAEGLDILPARGAAPEQITSARVQLGKARAALGRMKPKLAEAFLLHEVLGYELREIASLTGASVAAVQSRLVRGRRDFLRRTASEGSDGR